MIKLVLKISTMTEIQMDINPFNREEDAHYSEEQLKELYQQSQAGNAEARSLLLVSASKFVEAIILELQHLNIPEKYTFTALYQIGITELTRRIDNESFDHYRRFAVWCIRQKLKNVLMDKK